MKIDGYALLRKCDTFKEWNIDTIYDKEQYKRLKYLKEKNEKEDWAKLIELKQKIVKCKIIIKEI